MKRWVRLVVAAAVIVVLVVVLVLVTRDKEADAAAPDTSADPDRVAILDIPRETISGITIEREGGRLSLQADADGLLEPVYEHDVTFSRSRIDRIVGSASSLSSRRVIEESAEDPGAYGLAQPAAQVEITADGGTTTLLVGDRTPTGDGYYVRTADSATVYTVSTTWITPFFSSLDDLRDKTLAQLNPQELREVRIDTLEGRIIRLEPVRDDDDDPEMAFTALAVTSPFRRRYQASTNWLEEVAGTLGGFAIVRYVDDDPENLEQYGLANPRARVRVADSRNAVDVELGEPTEDGRYARFPGGRSVFVFRGAETLIRTRPYDAITPFAFIINIDLVDSFVVEGGGRRYVGSIERSPGEGDETIETYKLNGAPIEEDLFKDLYQWLIGLQLDAEAPNPQRGPAAVTLQYNLNNGSAPVVLEFVPQDGNYMAAYREGTAEFLIARAKLNRMLQAFADAADATAE